MSNFALIIYCGLITFLTRFSMIAILKKEMFNDRIREVLKYVPADKLYVNPDCGFGWSPRYMSIPKLDALVNATAKIRKEIST